MQWGFPGGTSGKEVTCGRYERHRVRKTPGSGRSPGGQHMATHSSILA